MEKLFIYKIQDIEDDLKYSQYIRTSEECKQTIINAVEYWQDNPDDEYINANNVYDCIEMFLKEQEIDFEWVDFNESNTINY